MGSVAGPLFGQTQQAGSSGSSSTGTSNSTLGANSFITLLAAQLQAQDPTNPMDPSQMMGELVSLNTLQTLTNIQQILQVATGVNPGQTSPPGTGSGSNGANANSAPSSQAMSARMVNGPSAANHDAIFQSKFNATSGLLNQ
ncbi:MAG TPA: flagellar hook capping FlgD N-terminal domain-containing protein [Candidatus Acidoferrum sp.]|nr:flagellar hook capping FlgD N-terminal domain-containing protein [Candidatus Acidoferrum sp.]